MGFSFKSCTSDDLLVQQRWTGAKGRLRREDCKFVKHDKLFSKWKILVGPADQKSSSAKDGKYQMQNVPTGQVGPGVYELGVTAPSWSKHSNTRTLSTQDIIPVYIGHSANIIQRLQKHGLHLEQPDPRSSNESVGSRSPRRVVQSGSSYSGELAKSSGSGRRLFSEVFALGSSIAFRWAHTDSKVVAEQVESELLAVFDYAWNKGNGSGSGSGSRRSRDILAKLFMAWPSEETSSLRRFVLSRKRSFWLFWGRRKSVGIKVALRKPEDTMTSSRSNFSNLCFLMMMRPQGPGPDGKTCGAVTGKGIMPCNAPSLRGRKRCLQHYDSKSLTSRGAATTTKHITMGSCRQPTVKVQTEPVSLKSCSLKLLLATQTKEEAKPVEVRKRHNSLSFNTWMKGDSADQRVHDSSDHVNARATCYDKPQDQYYSARRRVQHVHLSSKYVAVPDHDSRRR